MKEIGIIICLKKKTKIKRISKKIIVRLRSLNLVANKIDFFFIYINSVVYAMI